MKNFHAPSYIGFYSNTRFEELCKAFLLKIKGWDSVKFNSYLDESDEGKKRYGEMKTQFDAAPARHRIYLKNKDR